MNRPEFLQEYLNPLYEPNGDTIFPSVTPQTLVCFDNLFAVLFVNLTELVIVLMLLCLKLRKYLRR